MRQHVIRTQVLDVTTDNSADAFNLQQRMHTLFYSVLLPLIEKTFDQLSPSDRIVYLDSLSIDLGILTIEALDREYWTIEFTSLLTRQLQEAILTQSLAKRAETNLGSVSRQWLFYMQHGYLPWNSGTIGEGWYNQVLQELATDYETTALLRRLILTDQKALRRISRLKVTGFLVHLAEVLTGRNQSNLLLYLQLFEKVWTKINSKGLSGRNTPDTATNFWSPIFLYCASFANADVNVLIEQAVLAALDKPTLRLLLKQSSHEDLLSPFLPNIRRRLADRFQPDEKYQHPVETTGPKKETSRSPIPEEGVFVEQAGLVLLHPFIVPFFKIFDLHNGQYFHHAMAQQKGLSLLHFLATGNEEPEEHSLVVPKILCGYALDEPVEHQPLSIIEKDEAEELLRAVIDKWNILKSSSIEALRQSFLKRGGKLVSNSNGNFQLFVEAESLDVLLDHLPWGMSMIKFPWMNQILKVDWH